MADCYLGEIRPFASSVLPKGWAPCDGRKLDIEQNKALYSLLGTNFGGDGKTTFALPDLRGRTPVGAGPSGTIHQVGIADGSENVTLTEAETPAHNHSLNATSGPGSSGGVANSIFASVFTAASIPLPQVFGSADAPVRIDPGSLNQTGGAPHSNMQPYLVLNYAIALQGIYPSRQ